MAPYAESSAALIIPALNEESCIGRTLSSIPPGLFRQIVVADNGSTDRTAEIARAQGADVVFEPRRGYGAACLKALNEVAPDTTAIVFLQADGSENPEEARGLLAPIYTGCADMVIGSRVLGRAERGSLEPHQRFGNWLATVLIRWRWERRYTDLGPFRAIRLESLKMLDMQDRTYGWTVEMQIKALRLGLRVEEVPVSYRKRIAGENKVSGNLKASVLAGLKILWTIWRLR
jgi:glycosyltransferase involved in cell wall biosynthesis